MAKRLSVNISDEVAKTLEQIAERYDVTITEAIRRAISTEWFILEEVDKGNKILIADTSSEPEKIREVVFR